MPKPWTVSLLKTNQAIEIELLEPQPSLISPKKDQPIKQPKIEPVIKKNKEKPTESKVKQSPKVNENTTEKKLEPKPVNVPSHSVQVESIPKNSLNTGDVLEMIKNRTSVEVPIDFQARIGPAKSFYIPEQEIKDWMADIPYLDESVDKPKLQMKFYAEGIEGNIEKFFDKITISKTFTTKYGTKIHCALVGVLVACSWK